MFVANAGKKIVAPCAWEVMVLLNRARLFFLRVYARLLRKMLAMPKLNR